MSKKIIVAGGGHGGIACAMLLAKEGFDVTVYEKNSRNNMGYDWTDIFNSKSFSDIGLPLPPKDKLIHFQNMSFVPPSERIILRDEGDNSESTDIKMERKEIYNFIISAAEDAGVKFV